MYLQHVTIRFSVLDRWVWFFCSLVLNKRHGTQSWITRQVEKNGGLVFQGGGGLVQHLKKSYSLSDLTGEKEDENRNTPHMHDETDMEGYWPIMALVIFTNSLANNHNAVRFLRCKTLFILTVRWTNGPYISSSPIFPRYPRCFE